ncbi:hypothetical protein FVE85_6458 [Porphyridium purpureum]|uniref:Leishmanolysin-like peptidase n=1 Tax=Porphyridium purpureum TaxID=35688 RepID=A0A5J4Z7Q7_PORPP|nr:hypothetical protein FVE85_6458 [Porphyridium purpureum]|eukprot:POR4136..scf295_1
MAIRSAFVILLIGAAALILLCSEVAAGKGRGGNGRPTPSPTSVASPAPTAAPVPTETAAPKKGRGKRTPETTTASPSPSPSPSPSLHPQAELTTGVSCNGLEYCPLEINLIPNGNQDPRAVEVFELAYAKLRNIVRGQNLIQQAVTVNIYYRVNGLDGLEGVLGSAKHYEHIAVCTGEVSSTCSYDALPTLGEMIFDSNDFFFGVEYAAWRDYWVLVTLHELLHLLGVGSFWINRFVRAGYNTRVDCISGSYARYKYPAAMREWNALGGSGSPPVEFSTLRPGTDCTHWDELQLDAELMTGISNTYLNSLTQAPLEKVSAITFGAMEDLNYVLDWSLVEGYSMGQAQRIPLDERLETSQKSNKASERGRVEKQRQRQWGKLAANFQAKGGIQEIWQDAPDYVAPLMDRRGNLVAHGSQRRPL